MNIRLSASMIVLLAVLFINMTVSAEDIWMEAEAADSITEPMQIKSHESASGGEYISVILGKNSLQSAPFDGIAKYKFQVWGGRYQVILLVSSTVYDGDSSGHNSFWIRIKDSKTNIEIPEERQGWINNNEFESNLDWQWGWDEVRLWDGHDGRGVNFQLEKGTYTLEVGYREHGTNLDAILITDRLFVDQSSLPKDLSNIYRLGRGTFSSEPILDDMRNSVDKAESLIKNKKAEQAIPVIEQMLTKYDKWKKENSNDVKRTHQGLFCNLHFLLAQAKEQSGGTKKEIAQSYKLSVESGMLPHISEVDALFWLSENTNKDEYADVVEPLIANNTNYLTDVLVKSNKLLDEKKYASMIKFMENNLSACDNWMEKNPSKEVASKGFLSQLNYRLADVRKTTHAPKQKIAEAYANTFLTTVNNMRDQSVTAFTWLLENDRAEQSVKAIKLFFGHDNSNDTFLNIVTRICQDLERKKDWEKYVIQNVLRRLF